MTKILKVTDLKVLKNGYEVEINTQKYNFSEETVIKYRLVKGKEIRDLEEIIAYNDYSLSYIKVKNYILKYPNTRYYLFLKLKDKYDNLILNKILDDLVSEGFINDYEAGLSLYNSLMNRGYGLNYIKAYLKEKGISSELISDIIFEYDNSHLKDLIIKEYERPTKLDNNKHKEKIINYFIRRGFNYNDIKNILNELGV